MSQHYTYKCREYGHVFSKLPDSLTVMNPIVDALLDMIDKIECPKCGGIADQIDPNDDDD